MNVIVGVCVRNLKMPFMVSFLLKLGLTFRIRLMVTAGSSLVFELACELLDSFISAIYAPTLTNLSHLYRYIVGMMVLLSMRH